MATSMSTTTPANNHANNQPKVQRRQRPSAILTFQEAEEEEEKKDCSSCDFSVQSPQDVMTRTTNTLHGNDNDTLCNNDNNNDTLCNNNDNNVHTLPLSVLDKVTAAALWKEVTWYPVVAVVAPESSSTTTTTKTKMPHRRWMAIQGAVSTNGSTMFRRPLFRHAALWTRTAEEPYQAESWTPLVTAVRKALHVQAFNHVTLECWQWNEHDKNTTTTTTTTTDKNGGSKRQRQRSVTVVRERIDPTLDLEPQSPVIRVFLTGPLVSTEEDQAQPDHDDDDDNNNTCRIGSIYLRPKRFDANNQRRPTPRPQQVIPIQHHGCAFALTWQTNAQQTHEISLRPQPRHVTMMLTFRVVATWFMDNNGGVQQGVPRIIGRAWRSQQEKEEEESSLSLQRKHKIHYTQQELQTEWKRLTQAFWEEKRQEGLTTEQVYGGEGSFLVPSAKLKPCVAKLSPSLSSSQQQHHHHHFEEDGLSAATPTSMANSSVATSNHHHHHHTTTSKSMVTNSPIFDIHLVEDSEFADEDQDSANPLSPLEYSSNVGLSTASEEEEEQEEEGSAVALLVVDLQNDFLGDDPSFSFCRLTHKVSPLAGLRRTRLLSRIDELAQQVREQQGVVVFCKSEYGRWSTTGKSPSEEEGGQETTTASKTGSDDSVASSTATLKAGIHLNREVCCNVGTAGSDFHPEAAKLIQEDDIVMTKQWYSAFFETSLHAQLQRLGVHSVVVCGVTTNHSVSATVRSAAHLGYNVILSSDGTAQIDPSLQAETEAKLQQFASILAPKMSLQEILAPVPVAPRSLTPNGRDRQYFDGWSQRSAIGSGDSVYLPDFFDPKDAKAMKRSLRPCDPIDDQDRGEVSYVSHTERGGRGPMLMSYQCARNAAGHAPICRMAAVDKRFEITDWSASVAQAVPTLEIQAGHSFNFCRIVQHKSAKDCLRYRSDLCLDIKEGASIAIVALGDDLVLELRPKPGVGCKACSQKIAVRHNSLFLLGPETNRLYQYSIRCSRKAAKSRSRLSLTFREMVTFQDDKEGFLYGPGAPYQSVQDYSDHCRTITMWERAGMVACGASSLTTLWQVRNKMVDSSMALAVAAAPLVGMVALYGYMNYRRQRQSRDNESSSSSAARRLEQTIVRCNWQPLRFPEAKDLLFHASDVELFGVSHNTDKFK